MIVSAWKWNGEGMRLVGAGLIIQRQARIIVDLGSHRGCGKNNSPAFRRTFIVPPVLGKHFLRGRLDAIKFDMIVRIIAQDVRDFGSYQIMICLRQAIRIIRILRIYR